MPKRVTETELQHLEEVVIQHPAGISMAALELELGHRVSRRTIQRHLALLLDAGRLQRRGAGKLTIYLPPQIETAPEFKRTGAEVRS